MTFEAKDLMFDVFPQRAEHLEMNCVIPSPNQPAPCQPPSCQKNSAKAEEDEYERAALPSLAVMREQLRQALHG
jgi:hypothetical protein